MAHVFWTYVANFPDKPWYALELNDPPNDVRAEIKRAFAWSKDFQRKSNFRVFYENGDYEKIAAKDIFLLTDEED